MADVTPTEPVADLPSTELTPTGLERIRPLLELLPTGDAARTLTKPLGAALETVCGPPEAREAAAAMLGNTVAVYQAAQALKRLSGEIHVVLHAVGIAAALPYLLEADEQVQAVSLDHDASGVASRHPGLPAADLVTDRQAAEFTFIRWAAKGNGGREVKLLKNLVELDVADHVGDRRRVLYVTGGAPALRFLTSKQAIASKLRNEAGTLALFRDAHGSNFATVGDYWAALRRTDRVELVDLYDLAPDLLAVFNS